MEGLITADGGRIVKRAWLMLGGLVASPLSAQAAPDPLAPLPTTPPAASQQPAVRTYETVAPVLGPVTTDQRPLAAAEPTPPPKTVTVPKDWRGVFDAIDSGNWASAQAGIAALPTDPLTPLAMAELYTAKGSPVVDLASLQALL